MLILLVLIFVIANVEAGTCQTDPCLDGDDTAICEDPKIAWTCGPSSGSKDWVPEKGTELVSEIPVGTSDLDVTLSANKDIDIMLITPGGEKVAGYGGIVGTQTTKVVRGMTIYFSGDDTTDPVAETIQVDETKEPLNLYIKAWYPDTETSVIYSWMGIDPCDPADYGPTCSCSGTFTYDAAYGCRPGPIATYPDEVGPGSFSNIPNPLGGDFCIFFEFVSSITCKIQHDDNDHWFDGCGMIDGDVPTPSNDFGITLGRQGEIFFGVGKPDVSIKAGSGVAPGYADGSRHRVCAARSQSTGKIALEVDEIFMGEEYGQLGTLNDSPELHLGNTRLHPGYEFEGTLSSIELWDTFPCCLSDPTIMENHASLSSNTVYTPPDACLTDWVNVGTLDSNNYIAGDVYILGKFNKPDTLGCTIECNNTPACAAFSFSGGSMFVGETEGECILYKRTEPNQDYGANTRFCMKPGVLPKCSGNGKVCGQRERECWEMCGEAEGYCDGCNTEGGQQGACCRSDYNAGGNSICSTRVNSNWYLAPGYHQCVILD